MNRKLLVTLLQKNIQELELITQGFMEMTEFPMPIILLAQRKTEDIQLYIKELSEFKDEVLVADQIESVQTELGKSQNEEIEVSDEINLAEIDEILEIEEIAEIEEIEDDKSLDLIDDDLQIETEILDLPLNAPEVLVIEDVFIEKSTVEEIVIETELYIEEDSVIVQDETLHSISPNIDETRKTILGERTILTTHTRNELLSKADTSISSTLANKKITDIKQAINIGDRFRFQRELFRSNGEDMNKTLTYINQLATLDEVMSFLKSKYGWTADNEAADDFYQIVRRRFV